MRGRIRTIKPEVFSDEELWDLGEKSGLPVLQVFEGLWCFADREGRFEWRPRALKSLITPYWSGDFEAALDALARARFIVRYVVDGRTYGYVRNFIAHQRPDHREPPSVIPEPPSAHTDTLIPGGARAAPGHAEAAPGGNGTEGNGTEGNGREARATPTPMGVAKTYTMPCQEPPQAYLDVALMGGVSAEQAKSTWSHYWGAGLPTGGVERLHDWLTKRAAERASQLARLPTPSARHGPNQPNAGMTGLEIFEKARKAG